MSEESAKYDSSALLVKFGGKGKCKLPRSSTI